VTDLGSCQGTSQKLCSSQDFPNTQQKMCSPIQLRRCRNAQTLQRLLTTKPKENIKTLQNTLDFYFCFSAVLKVQVERAPQFQYFLTQPCRQVQNMKQYKQAKLKSSEKDLSQSKREECLPVLQ